jgi:hypothetical protein
MKGRQKRRPTKWGAAKVDEAIGIGKPGTTIEVWEMWKKTRKKPGTLTVSVGGSRWRPHKAASHRQISWDKVAEWLTNQ